MGLEKKIAVVTGAASGIGEAVVRRFLQEGAKVVAADINRDAVNIICDSVSKDDILPVSVDVTRKSSVDAMVNDAVEKFGKIDVLVNGAGIIAYSPFLEMNEEEWDRVISVNLKGYFLCGQAVARTMVKSEVVGRIINIASVASEVVTPETAHYAASKGGVLQLTKAMALDLAPYNITVNAVGPGGIETKMTEKTRLNPEKLEVFLNKIPFKRFGKPEEVAEVIFFLASLNSSYITGSIYYVDGGWLIQ